MKIHEYQAKALLARFGVPVPRGEVAETAAQAEACARRLEGPVVLKAQVHAGGRGKGTFHHAETGEPLMRPGGDGPLPGVVLADTPEAAAALAHRMLGQRLVTVQTGPQGRIVRRVLVEERTGIAHEYYLALLVDRSLGRPVFIASAEGGVDIERVAAERPQAVVRIPAHPGIGFSPWMGRRLAFALGVPPQQVRTFVALAASVDRAFHETDASLVEINPLVRTTDGRLLALDAKVNLDDNGLFRHADLAQLRDTAEEDPLEVEASKHGLNYVRLEGDIGCMVNGAGLAMATMDIIKHHGGQPANFLDVGGGATTEMVTAGFRILLADPRVKAVLINIFGGIMRCDVVARGVVAAARAVGVDVPVIVRLEGTNVEEGRSILEASGLTFQVARDMTDAAEKVVAAAREAG